MEIRELARFPFLPQASAEIQARGIDLAEVTRDPAYAHTRQLGRTRVVAAVERGDLDDPVITSDQEALREFLAYPIARMIVSCVADPYLIRRYSLAEARAAKRRLEAADPGFLRAVAGELETRLATEDGTFRMHFTDFLRHTRTMRDASWKLVNQVVDRGDVVLTKERAARALQNAIQSRVMRGLPLPVNDAILEAFRADVAEVGRLVRERKGRFRSEDLGKISITRLPPCMVALLAQIQNHENVPHSGRFAIVSFLHHAGVSNEEIFRIFGDVPDFAVDTTRYQIDHITGVISPTEYTPPECATMKSYGICPGGDELCQQPWMNHPLTYYRRKPDWIARTASKPSTPAGPPSRGPGPRRPPSASPER